MATDEERKAKNRERMKIAYKKKKDKAAMMKLALSTPWVKVNTQHNTQKEAG